MKKVFYKIASVLICAIYTAMLLPAASYAAGESLSAYAQTISAELFTQNEPYYAVTENLTLSSLSLPEGVSASFSSSDESVLKIVETEATDEAEASVVGKVSRATYEDKAVTLTVALTDGTDTEVVKIPLKVLGKAATVYYSDTFRYPSYKGMFVHEITPINSSTPIRVTPSSTYGEGWNTLYQPDLEDNTTINGRRFMTVLDSMNNNYMLKSFRTYAAEEYNYTRYIFGDKPIGKSEVTMRLMVNESSVPQIYLFQLWANYINENGTIVRKQAVDVQLHRRSDGGYLLGNNATGEGARSYTSVRPENGEWFTLTIAFDTENQVYDLYYNGEKLSTVQHNFYTKSDETLECMNINDFQFNSYRKNGGGEIYLDDMLVRDDSYFLDKNKHLYELRDALELSEIAIDSSGAVDSQAIDESFSIDYSRNDAEELMNTNNLSVEWLADDSGVLSVSGNNVIVSKGDLETRTALTARITDNNTGDYIDKSYELKVLCKEETQEINDVYNVLTAERLSTQALTAVTENLSLPSFDGVDIAWQSNNEALGNDGTVTRGDEDVYATLTATISHSDTSFTATKSFDVKILAKGKRVYSSSTLYSPDNLNKELAEKKLTGWYNSSAAQTERLTNTVVQDEDYNYVMCTERAAVNNRDYNFCNNYFTQYMAKSGEVSFRFKLLHNIEPQTYIFQLYGTVSDENDETATLQAVEIKLEYTKSGGTIKAAGPEVILTNDPLETGQWYTMTIAFDNGTKTYDLYIDGKKQNLSPLDYFQNRTDINYDHVDYLNMKYLSYNSYRMSAGGKFYVDDVTAVGNDGVQLQTVLYDGGEYRTTDTTEVITGAADGKVYLYNPTDTAVSGTLLVAGYKDDKMLWNRSKEVSLSAKSNAKVIEFSDLNIPFSADVKVKAFYMDSTSIAPVSKQAVSGNSLENMKPVTMTDSNTGNSYKVLNMFGEDIMRCYYSMQCWSADGTKLYFHDDEYNLYEYDVVKEHGRFLDRLLNDYTIVTSPLGNVFYINSKREIIRMDCTTYEKTVVTEIPAEYSTGKVSMIQVSNDESRISVEWDDLLIEEMEDGSKHESRFPVYDLEKGEWILDITYGFETEQYAPNHKSINPVRTNLVLFAHEGLHQKDRVWVMNMDTGVPYNVFVQKQYSAAETGETAGHEMWTYDGERAVFCNGAARIGGYSGFASVKYDGTNRRYINSDYSYLHAGMHPYTDRWAVSDTAYNGNDTNIVLIDCYTGDSYLIATVHQTGLDPGHGHPNFSFDGKTVCFGMYDENDVISIGWADVSKYIDNAPDVSKYSLSDNCTIETAERDHEVQKVSVNSADAFRIPAGGVMRVQYRGAELEKTAADITVRYLDSGSEAITIEYFVWTTTDTNSTLVRKTASLPVENSGEWVEKTISIEDINLENMERLEGDFVINAVSEEAVIASVSVAVK